jgi:hypothetical protein
MNIVSIIMQLLTPDLIGKLATMLGVDRSLVQRATSASIPAILAGLSGLASKNGGGTIIDAINKLDPNILGNLATSAGGEGGRALATTGSNILTSLLGGSTLSALATALSKYSGLNNSAAGSLIGVLTPIVLAALGQQQKAQGFDAGGLAKMLQGQKDNIAKALPADFSKLLAGSGLLDSVTPQMESSPSSAAGSVPMGDASSGGASWLPWLIGLAALVIIVWFIFGRPSPSPAPEASQPAAPAATSTTPAALAKIMAGDVDVGAQLAGALASLKTVLPTLKDNASAAAAKDKLSDAAAQLDKVSGLAAQLSADNKKALAAVALAGMQAIQPLIDSALTNSSVAAIVKPVLDGIKDKLTALSKS